MRVFVVLLLLSGMLGALNAHHRVQSRRFGNLGHIKAKSFPRILGAYLNRGSRWTNNNAGERWNNEVAGDRWNHEAAGDGWNNDNAEDRWNNDNAGDRWNNEVAGDRWNNDNAGDRWINDINGGGWMNDDDADQISSQKYSDIPFFRDIGFSLTNPEESIRVLEEEKTKEACLFTALRICGNQLIPDLDPVYDYEHRCVAKETFVNCMSELNRGECRPWPAAGRVPLKELNDRLRVGILDALQNTRACSLRYFHRVTEVLQDQQQQKKQLQDQQQDQLQLQKEQLE